MDKAKFDALKIGSVAYYYHMTYEEEYSVLFAKIVEVEIGTSDVYMYPTSERENRKCGIYTATSDSALYVFDWELLHVTRAGAVEHGKRDLLKLAKQVATAIENLA